MEHVAEQLGVLDKLERAGLDSPHDILMRPAADLEAMLSPNVVTQILDAASEEIYPWRTRCTTAAGRSPAMVSTGCSMMDRILGGGIPLGSITEVVAESACGKTQLGLQVCLTVQDPNALGGEAVYLFSEGRIPSVRLDQLATAYGLQFQIPPDTLKKNIHTMQLKDRQAQVQALNYQLPALLARRRQKIKVVVIDSIGAVYRGGDDKERFDRVREVCEISLKLKRLASEYNVAVVAINQVSDAVAAAAANKNTANTPLPPELVEAWVDFKLENSRAPLALFWASLIKRPVLGMTWSNAVTTRIRLARSPMGDSVIGTRRVLFVEFSPLVPRSGCEVVIDQNGLHGRRTDG